MNLDLTNSKEIIKFFEMFGCPVKMEKDTTQIVPKLILKVPRKHHHFIRWFFHTMMPLSYLLEVKDLTMWERFNMKSSIETNFRGDL